MFEIKPSGPIAARVSMTVVDSRVVLYSVVRCPDCNRKLIEVPGDPDIRTRVVSQHHASGEGRVLHCKRCCNWIEVIER